MRRFGRLVAAVAVCAAALVIVSLARCGGGSAEDAIPPADATRPRDAIPPQPSTGSLTIIAGFNASIDGEPCDRGPEGGFVHFEVKPIRLIASASGRTAVTRDWIVLPKVAYLFLVKGGDEMYGCWGQKTAFNLRPGTWSATATGDVTGTCHANVVAGHDTKVRIWNNECGGSRRRDP